MRVPAGRASWVPAVLLGLATIGAYGTVYCSNRQFGAFRPDENSTTLRRPNASLHTPRFAIGRRLSSPTFWSDRCATRFQDLYR
jgi:hypothetical protein